MLENAVGRPFDSAEMSQLRGNISAHQDFGLPHVARLSASGVWSCGQPTPSKNVKTPRLCVHEGRGADGGDADFT